MAVICLLLFLSFASCRKSDEPVRLEYMMWGSPEEVKTARKILKAFETKFPNIRVKVIHSDTDSYYGKIKTMTAAKNPPDIMYMDPGTFPSYASQGFFLDLLPYLNRDNREFRKEDFFPILMDVFKYKDHLFGVPKDFSTLALYYNKTLFDKARLDYPSDHWSWKDFLYAAHELTRDINGNREYGCVVEPWFGQWFAWVWQNGGEIMDKSNTKFLLGDPAYININAEALQFYADLIWKEKVAPPPTITNDFGFSNMFKMGRIGMCTYGRWMCMDFKDIKDFEWDVAPLPGKTRSASTLFVVCYAISAQTRHPEESWQLMKFLLSPESQTLAAKNGLAIPSRKSVADSNYFLEAKVVPQKIKNRVFLDQIEIARSVPSNPYWPEIQSILNREMEMVFLNMAPPGRKDPLTAKEAVQKAQAAVGRLSLSEFRLDR